MLNTITSWKLLSALAKQLAKIRYTTQFAQNADGKISHNLQGVIRYHKTDLLEPRVKSFCDKVGSTYVFKAGKPLPGGYEEGIRRMKTTKENTLFIGDQIFTDVLGAKRAGLYTIMVKPIHPKEEIQIVLKRYLERIVLFFYFRSIRKKSVEK